MVSACACNLYQDDRPGLEARFIDIVKQRTEITDTKLDSRIEENKLWKLAGLLGSYKLFVRRPGFDLNNATIADLDACAERNGYQ